jgi:hypothetical protein
MNAFLRFSASVFISLVIAQPAMIDFTLVSRPPDADPPDSASIGIIAGKPEQITGGITPGMTPLPPLSVVLKSVTPSACIDRQQVVYDVELTNTGTAPFSLSSSTAREDTRSEDYRKLTVVLMTETAKMVYGAGQG